MGFQDVEVHTTKLPDEVMCGRIVNHMPPGYLRETFDEVAGADILTEPGLLPRFNLAPTGFLPGIRMTEKGLQEWAIFRWGLIPRWAQPERIPDRTFNARGETVAEKPTFREAWKKRRCVVPVSGYYEWTGPKGAKQPFYFHLNNDEPLLLAGLWETWRSGDDMVDSCTVITRASIGKPAEYHHRMPVFLEQSDIEAWISGLPDVAHEITRKTSTEWIDIYPVSREVNNSRNDYASLITPIASN